MSNETNHHIVKYGFYVKVLLALLVLTGITVGVTRVELGALTVTIALLIASVKASLVLLYFMHLKFDKKILGIFLVLTMMIFVAVLLLTFLDYGFR